MSTTIEDAEATNVSRKRALIFVRRFHVSVGGIGFLAFVLTGAYLRMKHEDLVEQGELLRMRLRADHGYLLYASALNVLLGLYCTPRRAGLRRRLQQVGSALVLASPVLALWAFSIEQHNAGLARPLAGPTAFAALGGIVLHVVAAWRTAEP